MLQRPSLKDELRVLVLYGEGAVLLSDGGERVLHGALYARLAPLLDGRHTDLIVAQLEAEWDPAEVFFALLRLEAEGCVAEFEPDRRPATGAPGLVLGGTAGITLVVTDSYLRPELAEVNARQLRDGQPWLLARPQGPVIWVGPLMRPGRTACWRCLEHRLRRNRPFEYRLLTHPGAARLVRAPHRDGADGAVTLGEPEILGLEDTLLTIDTRDDTRRSERVTCRPQCPACGDVGLYARQADRAFTPASQRKRFTADGGYRSVPPGETVARYQRLVGPLLGVVRDVQAAPVGDGDEIQVCSAHYGTDPEYNDRPAIERGVRLASGKGMTRHQALASGLGEAIERYSCVFQGDEPRISASLDALAHEAIHPNLCMQLSDTQYAERESRNRESTRWQWIPRPIDPAEQLEWTPVRSLTTSARRYLPAMLLYAGYPSEGSDPCCLFDPNGNAAGNTLEEAVLQGLLELIERDSLAIWWYNRLARPGVDLAGAGIPYVHALQERYRSLGRDLWVLDLTTDLAIPSFAAISRRTGEGPESLLLGFGAHLDARIALTRALTEMNQVLGHVLDAEREGRAMEVVLTRWLREATLSNQPWLAPGGGPSTALSACPDAPSDDLADDLRLCTGRLAKCGLEAYVLDQTRPDIGVPVVKVIVPGLRHFRARFAPGRLYTVPAAMGWLDAPRPETALNPIAFFF